MKNLNEVTDLHNRRGNIAHAAAFARKNKQPLIVWPEDKLLLRVSDLPRFYARKSENWISMRSTRQFLVTSDEYLRSIIREGYGYVVSAQCDQLPDTTVVTEYEIVSR